MTIINRTRSLKLAGILAAIIISLLAMKASMLFFSQYRLLVWEKKDGSVMQVLGEKEGLLSACQSDLEQVKADKQAAAKALNPDLFN